MVAGQESLERLRAVQFFIRAAVDVVRINDLVDHVEVALVYHLSNETPHGIFDSLRHVIPPCWIHPLGAKEWGPCGSDSSSVTGGAVLYCLPSKV